MTEEKIKSIDVHNKVLVYMVECICMEWKMKRQGTQYKCSTL